MICSLPPPPASANVVKCMNDDDNGAVDNRGWRSRAARLSTLLCSEYAGLWRAPSYDHKDAMNDGDGDKDAAWEPA